MKKFNLLEKINSAFQLNELEKIKFAVSELVKEVDRQKSDKIHFHANDHGSEVNKEFIINPAYFLI